MSLSHIITHINYRRNKKEQKRVVKPELFPEIEKVILVILSKQSGIEENILCNKVGESIPKANKPTIKEVLKILESSLKIYSYKQGGFTRFSLNRFDKPDDVSDEV